MATLNVKVGSTTAAVDDLVEKEVKPAESSEGFKQKNMVQWLIRSGTQEGHIIASSNLNDYFEGPTSEFNRRMRL
jgi:hypothetical protein